MILNDKYINKFNDIRKREILIKYYQNKTPLSTSTK